MTLANYESNRENSLDIISYNKDHIKLTQKKLRLIQKIFNSMLFKNLEIFIILLHILYTFSLLGFMSVFLSNNIDLKL